MPYCLVIIARRQILQPGKPINPRPGKGNQQINYNLHCFHGMKVIIVLFDNKKKPGWNFK